MKDAYITIAFAYDPPAYNSDPVFPIQVSATTVLLEELARRIKTELEEHGRLRMIFREEHDKARSRESHSYVGIPTGGPCCSICGKEPRDVLHDFAGTR